MIVLIMSDSRWKVFRETVFYLTLHLDRANECHARYSPESVHRCFEAIDVDHF